MRADWPTELEDMQMVEELLSMEAEATDGQPVPVAELVISDDKALVQRFPDWMGQLNQKLSDRYGDAKANDIINKIITRCMIGEEEVH
jgi:hypothetical protein